jgi:hypothetical protein
MLSISFGRRRSSFEKFSTLNVSGAYTIFILSPNIVVMNFLSFVAVESWSLSVPCVLALCRRGNERERQKREGLLVQQEKSLKVCLGLPLQLPGEVYFCGLTIHEL